MSGVFGCACSLQAPKTVTDSLASPLDVTGDTPGARRGWKSSPFPLPPG